MKAVILAGGLGTRLSEETVLRPKPMVEIGGKPILWHIMQIHAAHGISEFILALGYKGEMVKEYFLNFFAINNDLSVDLLPGLASDDLAQIDADGNLVPLSGRHVRIQTPQVFAAGPLFEAYRRAAEVGFDGTDTSACVEQFHP